MNEFITTYLTMLGGAVGIILIVLAIGTALTYLYRALEPRLSEDWAMCINVTIVFLLIVLLFSLGVYFGGEQQ